MGTHEIIDSNRLPLGNSDFSSIKDLKMIYVDKTDLIANIARRRTPIFLSRPRRFGKSLLINTLSSLFSNDITYFHGLAIEKIWNDKTYQVVRLDFSSLVNLNQSDFVQGLCESIIDRFDMEAVIPLPNTLGLHSPARIMRKICDTLKNNSIVLLIDEYDAPITHCLNRPDRLEFIIPILDNFYATIKEYIGKFRFIFITGITRLSHISIFSAFNNIIDLSFEDEFNNILGFTQSDIEKYFDAYVENAAHSLHMSATDMYQRLKQYYDGFQFSLDSKETVYNPWSILNFFTSPQKGFVNYWFNSGGLPSIIMQHLKAGDYFDPIKYQNKKIYKAKNELLARYEIDTIPKEILLYQAGYFTIRKVENEFAELVFPNTEVEDSIFNLYLITNNITINFDVQRELSKLIINIDQRKTSEIIRIFNIILNECVSILSTIFNDERSVRDIIYAAIPQNKNLQKIKERETVKGQSDLELLTEKTHMVIEFKRTRPDRDAKASLQAAIQQIQQKMYGLHYFTNRTLYRVAMVISTEDKAILTDYFAEVQ